MVSLDETTLKLGFTLDVSTSVSITTHIYISSRGHFACMQIKEVAQGFRLGNQAEFVPRPNTNRSHQKTPLYRTFPGPPLNR